VRWVAGVGTRRQEGDCDGEFGGEEEGQVEQAGAGDCGRLVGGTVEGGGEMYSWSVRWGRT